jgi:NADPH-dependent curcumin reductase CurA
MARTHIDKRSRLVSAAVGLAYQNGFGATSLTDIAREDGLENAPEAFIRMLSGRNFGKALVRFS